MKEVVVSDTAISDLRGAAEYYRDQAGDDVAVSFLDAVDSAFQQIGGWPGSGSTRFAELLKISQLRTFSLDHFPYIVFYIDQSDYIDVWRVFHTRRDILGLLGDGSSGDHGDQDVL